jgi:hypothetical protein
VLLSASFFSLFFLSLSHSHFLSHSHSHSQIQDRSQVLSFQFMLSLCLFLLPHQWTQKYYRKMSPTNESGLFR